MTTPESIYEVGSMRTPDVARPITGFGTLDEALAWCQDDPTQSASKGPVVRPWVARVERHTGKRVLLIVGGTTSIPRRRLADVPSADEMAKTLAWENARRPRQHEDASASGRPVVHDQCTPTATA